MTTETILPADQLPPPVVIDTLRSCTFSDFAQSLVAQWDRYRRLSDKQWAAGRSMAHKMITRQSQPAPVTESTSVGTDLTGVANLFSRVQAHLKNPSVLVNVEGVGTVRLRIAKQGKYAGNLQVLGLGDFESRAYYGYVDGNAEYHPQKDGRRCATAIAAALAAFAADPAGVAASYGRLTGNCCFCNTPLKDARSTSVGYGPDCAKRWELPWGSTH